MDDKTFNKFRKIIYDYSGISLGAKKKAFVSSRLNKRMRKLEIDDYRDYLKIVVENPSSSEKDHMIDAISTNVTHFFRESDHFDFLSEVVSDRIKKGQRRIRFWSSACSTGEEPYSMAITLLSTVDMTNLDIKILATDISSRVLHTSRRGVYEEEKVVNIPAYIRDKYFESGLNDGGSRVYTTKKMLNNLISFNRINLSNTPYPMKGPFDIIFCRNVLIYFNTAVKSRLIQEFFRLLSPGGYLITGHTESLGSKEFKTVKPSIYLKKK